MSIGKKDVEEGIIGSRLVDDTISFTNMGIVPTLFFDIENREIATAILNLEGKEIPVDLLTVRQELIDSWKSVANSRLIQIANSSFTSSNASAYAVKLKEEGKRVEILRIADELKFQAETWTPSTDAVFSFANRLLNFNTVDKGKYEVGFEAYENLTNYLDERRGKDLFGWSFGKGFEFLDKYTKGIQKGKTYRIGAPSNEGKTQLTYSMINACLSQGAKVAFFTLENDNNFTLTNICANAQKVNSYKLERGEEVLDTNYVSSLKDKFYLIDDTYELSEIFARILEIKPDVVFLDFIGQVNIKGFEEIKMYGEYARRVQKFVKREKLSWIDLSNLAMGKEDEMTIKATWGFFGDAGLKNLADVGIHLYRFTPFNDFKNSLYGTEGYDKWRNKKVVGLYISKNRLWVARVGTHLTIDFDYGWQVTETSPELITKFEMSFPSTTQSLNSNKY